MNSALIGFKPLLAVKVKDFEKLKFPKLASRKMDGIRCCTLYGGPHSREIEPIPNIHVWQQLSGLPDGVDGEIMTFANGTHDDFNVIQSKIMSADGKPFFRLMSFDDFSEPDKEYYRRLEIAERAARGHPHVRLLEQVEVNSIDEIMELTNRYIDEERLEGLMLRDPHAKYKFGRSTEKQGILLKIKRFDDSEAVVIGFVEQMKNTNTLEEDNLGFAKRSSAKAGKIPKNTLGAFICLWKKTIQFEIGTGIGLTADLRKEIWDNREKYLGSLVTFSYQGVGPNGKPRFPSFKGFRKDLHAANVV